MPHKRNHRSGLSLLELLVAFTVLALILGSIGMVGLAGRDAYQQGLSAATLETRARHALERAASELTSAVGSTLTPNPNTPMGVSTVQFQTSQGYVAGAPVMSTMTGFALASDPNDADDGIDNDGDGLVDERQLVLVRNQGQANEVRTVLCSNVCELLQGETLNTADDNANGLVDESGFTISADGEGTVRLRLSLAARDPKNNLVTRTAETAVHMRN